MSRFSSLACLAGLALAFSGLGSAQIRPQTGTTGTTGQPAPGGQRGRQQPCWQVAGVSQKAVQEHHQLEESTRSQVQSVCSNSSLSAQQKQQQIRQIRENARKQMESLISPQQEEALRSCRESRGEKHGGGGHRAGGGESGEGPCGEMPNATGSRPSNATEPPQ